MKRSLILNDLFVYDEYRNRGVAKLLLEAAKSYANVIEAKGISLETARKNEKAQRLYEKNGYTKNQDFYHYELNL